MSLVSSRLVCLDIFDGLLGIPSNVEGVARSFGNGETEVQGDAARNGTKTDDHSPHLVNGKQADAIAGRNVLGCEKRLFEARCDAKGHHRSGELTNALHGENGAHHCTSPFRCCKSKTCLVGRNSLQITFLVALTRR